MSSPVLTLILFVIEPVGVAGVEGNGQQELVKCITGLEETAYTGDIVICGSRVNDLNIKGRRDIGMAYIPEDRMNDGVAGELPISDNLIFSSSSWK